MIKRVLSLLRRDLLSTGKDHLLIYVTVAPLLIALGLRLFLPALGQAGVNAVVTPEMPRELVAALEPYLSVQVVRDRTELNRRVMAYGDTVGIVPGPAGGYTVVLEGNESHDSRVLPRMVLEHVTGGGGWPAMQLVEVTTAQVPLRELVGAFMAISTLFLIGAMMGFHIIEDKESNMLAALWVSPLSPRDYVAARSLLAVLLSVVLVYSALWLMGLTGFDPLQLLAMALASALTTVLVGFLIGALSSNQITGVANFKFGILLVLLPAILSLLIPARFLPTLYWLPTYWAFAGFRTILEGRAGWETVGPQVLWTLVTGLAFLAVLYRWLRGRIAFAGN